MALQRVQPGSESCELCDERDALRAAMRLIFGLPGCSLVCYRTIAHALFCGTQLPAIESLRFGKRLETTDFHTAA